MLRTSAPHIYISYYTYKSSHIYLFIDPRSFPLTDATSLLLRLQLEPEPIGIDLKGPFLLAKKSNDKFSYRDMIRRWVARNFTVWRTHTRTLTFFSHALSHRTSSFGDRTHTRTRTFSYPNTVFPHIVSALE